MAERSEASFHTETQKGAQEEFKLLLASNLSGLGRYVEWQRAE
jgi:hypothetical protein